MHHENESATRWQHGQTLSRGKSLRLLTVCVVCVLIVVVASTFAVLTPTEPAHADSACGWLLPCLTPVASPLPTATPTLIVSPTATPAPKPTAPTRPVASPTSITHPSPAPTVQPALAQQTPLVTPSSTMTHQSKGKTPTTTTKKSVTVQRTRAHDRNAQPAQQKTVVAPMFVSILIVGGAIVLFLAVLIALLIWRRRYRVSRPGVPLISWEPTPEPAPTPDSTSGGRGWTDTVKAPVIKGNAIVRPSAQATTMYPKSDFHAPTNVSSPTTAQATNPGDPINAANSPQSDTLIGLPRQHSSSPWYSISDEPFIT
jgi:hypothetical protein